MKIHNQYDMVQGGCGPSQKQGQPTEKKINRKDEAFGHLELEYNMYTFR